MPAEIAVTPHLGPRGMGQVTPGKPYGSPVISAADAA